MTTEIGYTTDPSNKQGIPEDVEAKYMPRLILEQILHEIRRTYIYELIDVGPKVSKNDAAFGLVRNDGTPKPAFNALKNLIQITMERPILKIFHSSYQATPTTSTICLPGAAKVATCCSSGLSRHRLIQTAKRREKSRKSRSPSLRPLASDR